MSYQLKRRPLALSYSSLSLYESDPEEFFLKYLAGTRAPRIPQMNFMAIGSAFDARVKASLHEGLFGAGADPRFEFDALFVEQVEEQNRDWALGASQYVFDAYVYSEAYDDLDELLARSTTDPVFETTEACKAGGVPISGKPDLRFTLPGLQVVLDWKVRNFCSKSGGSPSKGYRLCRDGWDPIARGTNKTKAAPLGKPSASHNTAHDLYMPVDHRGIKVSAAWLETCNDEYADQISMYGWMLGTEPGDDNVVAMIDEIVAKPDAAGPLLRVASHRARVSRAHQLKLLERLQSCWSAIQSGHVFKDLSREENDSRCEILDAAAASLKTDGTAEENWFNEVTRSSRNF